MQNQAEYLNGDGRTFKAYKKLYVLSLCKYEKIVYRITENT